MEKYEGFELSLLFFGVGWLGDSELDRGLNRPLRRQIDVAGKAGGRFIWWIITFTEIFDWI